MMGQSIAKATLETCSNGKFFDRLCRFKPA
jgi:hypothetical protein